MSEAIQKLQALEQNLQMIRTQLHAINSQLLENTTAQEALSQKSEGYVFVGNIMVKQSAEKINEDLAQKIERVEKTKNSLEVQEKTLLEQKKKLENELLGEQNE